MYVCVYIYIYIYTCTPLPSFRSHVGGLPNAAFTRHGKDAYARTRTDVYGLHHAPKCTVLCLCSPRLVHALLGPPCLAPRGRLLQCPGSLCTNRDRRCSAGASARADGQPWDRMGATLTKPRERRESRQEHLLRRHGQYYYYYYYYYYYCLSLSLISLLSLSL